MKQYKVTCKEITGIRGKILTNGTICNEDEFIAGHAAELVASKHLEEYTEPVAPAEKKDEKVKK